MNMQNIMIDLETLGVQPGCVVLSIGAVFFDPESGTLGPEFYQAIDMNSAMCAGLKVDPETLRWWLGQGESAAAVFNDLGRVDIMTALKDFGGFIKGETDPDEVLIWGNGSSFDNTILAAAYEAAHLKLPWNSFGDRCYRTLKSLVPDIKLERVGTHHNALDDAKSQALHAIKILQRLCDAQLHYFATMPRKI